MAQEPNKIKYFNMLINYTLGHAAGDEVIRIAAEILR